MGTRSVRIEVLVNVEDKICECAVDIFDRAESCCRATGDEGLGRRVIVAWKENDLGSGSSCSDRSHGSLNGSCPKIHIRHCESMLA